MEKNYLIVTFIVLPEHVLRLTNESHVVTVNKYFSNTSIPMLVNLAGLANW